MSNRHKLIFLGLFTSLATHPFYSSAQDVTPPELIEFDFSPKTIDTSTSAKTVKFTLRATDDISGVQWVNIGFISPSGGIYKRATTSHPVFGDPLDGIYEGTIEFSQYSPQGIWEVSYLTLHDSVSNYANVNTSELNAQGFPTELLVGVNTPVGSPVVTPFPGITLTFDNVTEAGITSVNTTVVSPPPVPPNFQLVSTIIDPETWVNFFEITTTALFVGSVTIHVIYDDTGLTIAQEKELQLQYIIDTTWKNITDPKFPKFAKNEIQGTVTTLSLFAVVLPLPIPATVDLDPDTLNLKSQGKFVSSFIEFPEDFSVAEIDAATVKVSQVNDEEISAIYAEAKPTGIGDKDIDGIPDLMVKFDRASLISVLPVAEQVKIKVEGMLKDGTTTFEGEGFIRTILPGMVKSNAGGVVAHPFFNARVSIPSGALGQDTEITVLKITAVPAAEENSQNQAASQKQIKRHGAPFRFGPEGIQFAFPVTLTLPYDPADLEGNETLQIAYWDTNSKTWELLDSIVDRGQRIVTAPTTHFSLYQIMGSQTQASTSFDAGEIYAFPNPAKRGAKPTIHAEVGVADSLDIHIYDISGDLVHEATLSMSPQLIDDGQGPQYAYEYTWDTSNVGSGVYIYVVTAHKNGFNSVKRIAKCAVIK